MRITVYSTPNCMGCKMTYRELDKHGIEYDIVDITENAAAREYVVEELRYQQAPVIVVDDNDHWSGFRPDHLDRVAALRAA